MNIYTELQALRAQRKELAGRLNNYEIAYRDCEDPDARYMFGEILLQLRNDYNSKQDQINALIKRIVV